MTEPYKVASWWLFLLTTDSFLFTIASRKAVKPTLTSFCGFQGFFSVEKRPEREAGHSSSCIEVQNEWSCTSAPPPPCTFMMWKGKTSHLYYSFLGWVSSVGIVTRYGLDGPGIESRWRGDFPHPSRPALATTQSPVQWISGLLTEGKTAGACR